MPVPEELLTQDQDGEHGRGIEFTPNFPLQPESSKEGPPALPSPATGFLEDSQSLPLGASFVVGYSAWKSSPYKERHQPAMPPFPRQPTALGMEQVYAGALVSRHTSPTGVSLGEAVLCCH